MDAPRVALFADSHNEANGVARTTSALVDYARRRQFPLMVVHAGPDTRMSDEGSIARVALRRLPATSFKLEHDLQFDLALWRHLRRVETALRRFQPEVLHFTGPSDVGQMGVFLGYRLGVPMIASWHTNLHEYASRRLTLTFLPPPARRRVQAWAERLALKISLLFYRIPSVVLSPNGQLSELLERETHRPTVLMSRGVDTVTFTPARRRRTDTGLNIGFVGRLSPEKSVRVLPDIEAALAADGHQGIRFTIVGDGCERSWLQSRMPAADFTGVLRGEALATAYADMDIFVFPSQTETVGNVVIEALASGVPVVAMAQGGPRFVVGDSHAAVLAGDHRELIDEVRALARDRERREAMRIAARQRAMELSWDRIFDDVYGAYRRVLVMNAEGAPSPSGRCRPHADGDGRESRGPRTRGWWSHDESSPSPRPSRRWRGRRFGSGRGTGDSAVHQES